MYKLIQSGIVAIGLLVTSAVVADELRVEYASFYSHLKKIDGEDTQLLEFGFGFMHVTEQQLCQIKNAYIHTPKIDIPIEVNNYNRFSLPSEKALKLAKAEVVIELQQPVNQCDMSVQIHSVASMLKPQYSMQELQLLTSQFAAFFEQMGSFMSFMMPSVNGVVLELPDDSLEQAQGLANVNAGLTLQNNKLSIHQDWLGSSQQVLHFSAAPLKITALIE